MLDYEDIMKKAREKDRLLATGAKVLSSGVKVLPRGGQQNKTQSNFEKTVSGINAFQGPRPSGLTYKESTMPKKEPYKIAPTAKPTSEQRISNINAFQGARPYSLMTAKEKAAADTTSLHAASTSAGNRFAQGAVRGVLPVAPRPVSASQKKVKEIVENTTAGKVGNVAGTMASFAIPYMGLSGKVGAGLSKVGKFNQLGNVGKAVTKSIATDLAVGLPLNVNYALNKEGLRGEDALKSIALNTGLDVALGGAIEAVGGLILKSGKKVATGADFNGLSPVEKEEVIKMLPAPKEKTMYANPKGEINDSLDFPQTKTYIENERAYPSKNAGDIKTLNDIAMSKGMSVKQYAQKLSDDFDAQMESVIKSVEDFLVSYKPRGIDVSHLPSNSRSAVLGTSPVRTSNNDPLYSMFYEKYGHAPTKTTAREFAEKVVVKDLHDGGKYFFDDDMMRGYDLAKFASEMSAEIEDGFVGVRGDNLVYGKEMQINEPNYKAARGQRETPFRAAPGEMRYAPRPGGQETSTTFMQQVNDVFAGKVEPSYIVRVGDTPESLVNSGAKSAPLTIHQSTLRKIVYPEGYMGGKHNLGFNALEKLPEQLENPIAVLKSSTQNHSLIVVTELIDNAGNPVIVPIHLNKNGNIGITNVVPSAYGRKGYKDFIEKQKKLGNVLYENKKIGLDGLPGIGLQLSELEAKSDPIFNNSVRNSAENVNGKFSYDDAPSLPQDVKYGSVERELNTIDGLNEKLEVKGERIRQLRRSIQDGDLASHPEWLKVTKEFNELNTEIRKRIENVYAQIDSIEAGSKKKAIASSAQSLGEATEIRTVEKPRDTLGFVPDGFVETEGMFKRALRTARRGFVSGQEAVERFAKGQDGLNANDLTQAVRTSKGTTGYIFEKGLVGAGGERISDVSYRKLIETIPEKARPEFNTYKQHLHNIARTEQGKPVYEQCSIQDSQKIVSEMLQKHPEFKRYSDDINEWWNEFAEEWLVKSGRLSQKQWDAMRTMYPDYIPTYRVNKGMKGTGGSFGNAVNAPQATRGAKGGTSEVIPLEDSFLGQIERIVSGTRKNNLYLNIIKAIEEEPQKFGSFGRKAGKIEEPKIGELSQVLDEADLENFKKIKEGVYRLTAYENGQPISAYISKEMKDALTLLDDPIGNDYIKMVSGAGKKITSPVKALITGTNPYFAVANMMRDFPTYLIHSDTNMLKATSGLVKAMREISTNGELYNAYRALGGGQSGYYTQGKGFNEAIRFNQGKAEKVGKALSRPFETLGEVTETIPRLAEFINGVEKYGNTYAGRLKALQMASDVTVNFSRTAPVTKALDGWVMYLNAAVQGLDKFARQVKSKPFKTAGRSSALIAAPVAALTLYNRDNPHYQDLDDRTKQNYYVIPDLNSLDSNGQATRFIKIPMTREYGLIFGASLDVVSDIVEGKENPMKGLAETASSNFMPPTEGFFSPVLKNLPSNKDFAGRPIVPQGMENLDPMYQKDYRTSGAAQSVANAANGIKYAPEALKSPMKVDYLLSSYGGGLGQVAKGLTSQQYTNLAEAGVRGIVEPLSRRFTADPLYQSGVVSDFYDRKEAIEREVNNERYGEGTPSDYKTPAEKEKAVYTKISDAMAELRKQERAMLISNIPKSVKEQRSREIRQKINTLARSAKPMAEKERREYKRNYIPEISHMSDYKQEVYRNEIKKTGVTPAKYAEVIKGLDLDGNDSVSQAEAREVLNETNLTKEQKRAIWPSINKSWKGNPYIW